MNKGFTELRFGTSGLRDTVVNMTDMECYINAGGFISYLEQIGEFSKGDTVALGADRRPSSPGIKRAVAQAVKDMGGEVDDQGLTPSPALALYATTRGIASVMITGSHIPSDRNGIKFTKKSGEVLKSDEEGILSNVKRFRETVYAVDPDGSLFDDKRMFKEDKAEEADSLLKNPEFNGEAVDLYKKRYTDVFPKDTFPEGTRIFLYQHSAVGRDVVKDIFTSLGAEILCPDEEVGITYKDDSGVLVDERVLLRSSEFVSVDTESVSDKTMAVFSKVMEDNSLDIGISLDGDSDRPLLVYRVYDGEKPTGDFKYVTGDILGLLAVLGLGSLGVSAGTVCIPVSANDSIEDVLEEEGIKVKKTRIGSPYVIASMNEAIKEHNEKGFNVFSWESNGGFLTGTDIEIEGNKLIALPTRDAVLPLLSVILMAVNKEFTISELIDMLPSRYTHADRKKEFPLEKSRAIISMLTPGSIEGIVEVEFNGGDDIGITAFGNEKGILGDLGEIKNIRSVLESVYTREDKFGIVSRINYVDGVRIYFNNKEISHLRPSGNAPEFRNYAIADTPERAREIVGLGLEKIIPALAEKSENQ